MLDDVAGAVAQLPGLPDLEAFWDAVDARLAEGGAAFLADVGISLRETYGAQPVPHVRAALDGLVRRLAMLPWPGHVDEALRLAAGAAIPARYVASLLATGQDAQDLLAVLDGDGPLGMRACLVQELVLRGRPAPVRMPRGHPLSVLPTELTELEQEPPMPRYGLDWTSYPSPLPAVEEAPPIVGLRPAPFIASPGPDTAAAAFATWTAATVENRVVEIVEPVAGTNETVAGTLATIVGALDLENRGDVPAGSPARGALCTPELAWRLLFAAASMGGASTRGEYGAFGRLAAWHSLGGLTASAEDASTALIEGRAREYTWFRFRVSDAPTLGPRPAGSAAADPEAEGAGPAAVRDVGLAALDAGHRHVTVLAALDS